MLSARKRKRIIFRRRHYCLPVCQYSSGVLRFAQNILNQIEPDSVQEKL